MVPEETCVDCVRIATSCDSDKTWISGINSITKDKLEIHCEAVCDTSDKIRARNYGASEEDVRFIKGIVLNLCDSVVPDSVKMREVKLDRAEVYRRKSNRRASLIDQDLKNNTFVETINPLLTGNRHRRALSECILEKEPEDVKYFTSKININLNSSKSVKVDNVQKPKVPRKKKFSFNSFFHKKDKHRDEIEEEHIEEYDKFDSSQSVNVYKPELAKLKKAYSALELNQKTSPLQRTNSFIKKLVNLGGDSSSLLKRSFSVRDFSKKKDKEKVEKHVDTNEQKWRQSLQSLVETDISVSYNDLSYIDYNALNDISYEEETGSQVNLRRNDSRNYSNIERTQSMFVKSSPQLKRPSYLRIASTSEERPPDLGLSAQSGATSLPSLCHFNIQENGSNIQEPLSPTPRLFQRRPQSISSEDGARSRSSASGSFRSAGSGCAKLKRHNACRQKNRNAASLTIEIRNDSERKVRSRSLNHLDTLDMRQGIISTADAALKDSRSEPDCTKPILPPPALNPEPPTPTTDVPPARKHMLSRSQKSSSECFTVNFEVGVGDETWDNELFFPAQRGFTLLDHIGRMCESHNIDLSTCEARLLDKENNSETLIPFTQDTANLVGRHIRITAKDSSNKKLSGPFHSNHSRKQSGSYRTKPSSYFSSSTEESTPVATSTYSLHDADQKKQIKQRFTAFFANAKDTKLEALVEQLDKYTKQGIPSNPNYRKGQCESVDALYKLEDDWKDIVEFSDLNEKQQQQQTVLWELIKTEVAYIKMLKVVTDLFLACLKDLQSKSHLKEIDTVKLFSNITEILDANVIFWRNTLFPLVKNMRQYKRPPCIESMLEGFSQIHEVFQPYYIYCAEQSRCQHYCRENLDSEFFTAYLTWCESQKDCNRLRLMDILVQPMQRLTKYGLLLKAVLKNTEEDVEKESLSAMIKMVDEFVNSVNLNLKHRQDSERLKGIIARIESYDAVESKDDDVDKLLKSSKLMQLDLNKPMINCPPERKRHLLLEGDLKLKDNLTSKMEVHCFLLTDMLLICKPSTKKGGATVRVVRQPYLVDRLVVHELARETPSLCVVYKNEFDMAVAVFILQSNDPRKLKGWKDGILKAQALYKQAKQTRQSSSFADESMDAEYYTDFSEFDLYHSLQLAPRSPLASSSRASRVSSLAHSHSGSVEMNDQSSVGSAKDPSRGVSVENDNRTASISSDEGVQPLPPDKSPVSQKNSFKNRLFPKTPNTLSVQPYGSLGQSLPNLTLGSPNIGGLSLNLNQNTLSVPSSKNGGHLLSPTHRGVSYPPPSPTRGNLRRSLAISQNKNPPLIKTRQVNSASSVSQQMPTSFDFDVPVIAGVSRSDDHCESFSRGSHRQAMKRTTRYHTAGVVDDIKKNDNRDATIHKRLSWNCTSQEQRPPNEDQT